MLLKPDIYVSYIFIAKNVLENVQINYDDCLNITKDYNNLVHNSYYFTGIEVMMEMVVLLRDEYANMFKECEGIDCSNTSYNNRSMISCCKSTLAQL